MSTPRPSEARGPSGPMVQVHHCIPKYQGSVRFELTVSLGSLVLSGIKVLQQGEDWWTVLPRLPKLDTSGKAMARKGGGYISEPIVEIPNEESKRKFDAAVLAALAQYREENEV